LVFEKTFEGLAMDHMEGNEEIFDKLMGDKDFRKIVSENLLHKVHNAVNALDY
jgi:type I restriction enzyme R subunit